MKKICFITTISITLKSFVLKTAEYIHENTEWDISFICNYDEELEKSLPNYIHYIPVKMERGISLTGIKAMFEMIKIFKREKFDLIQYSTPNAALYASIAAKIVGCKVRNYHLMGFRFMGDTGLKRKLLKGIEKITCKSSTSIECVSISNLEFGVKEKLFSKDKATVVWNGSTGGVDLTRFDFSKRKQWRSEIREEFGYSDNDFIYGFVGRITRDKGVNELLNAFLNLKDKSKLFIIGNLESNNHLDNALLEKAYNHPNIQFHASVSDIERDYAAIDVLVLPSYREGFGNVIIEAAAVGTPAIVTNIPGPIDAIIENETALTVSAQNISELHQALQKICTLDYKQMGIAASKFAESHFGSTELNNKILDRQNRLLELN